MYTPQFRFVLLISLFVIFGTLAQVLYSYSFGEKGLNIEIYISGVLTLLLSTVGGFVFIWMCSKFITFNGLKATGFEGVFRDEYGTNFVFKHPIRLTKFLPDLIAKPINGNIHPIESELIAFLSGYKNMPFDIYDPKSLSIYEHSMAMWRHSKRIKNTNSYHHITALSKYLGLIYVYKAKRKSAPLWQFWVKDKIKYSKRCLFHGGLSSFILSTMPSFNSLDEKTKRSLLTAVRFADNPMSIPANCDQLTFSLYENTHRAEQRLKKVLNKNSSKDLDPSQTDILQFKQQIKDFLQSGIKDLDLNPSTPANQSDGVYLGLGVAIIRLPCLLSSLSKNLTPDIRSAMDLWDISHKHHKNWDYLIEVLQEKELLADSLDEQKINHPVNSFVIDSFAIHNALLIKIEQKSYPNLRGFLDNLPQFKSYALIEKNEEDLIKEIKQKSTKIDEFIRSLYS